MLPDNLTQISENTGLPAIVLWAAWFLVYLLAGLVPICTLLYLGYYLLTLPLRRNERARLLLDLIERGLKEGRSPEMTVTSASASHDRSLGIHFHLAAAYIEQGLRMGEALDKVPRLVPLQIRTMLKAGERVGDLAIVLPACRTFLRDGVSHVRGALNYLVILIFAITPASLALPVIIRIKVLPSFEAMFSSMLAGGSLPAFTRLIFYQSDFVIALQVALVLVLWLALVLYEAGPRLHDWFHRCLPRVSDWLLFQLPWRRRRLQRDFSAVLAALLDAGVPEAEAVQLAADATANVVLCRRAARVRARLAEGEALPEALRSLDRAGELHWRLANALRRGNGFVRALAGWQESLDAKAFQLEQSAAQLATTTLVLLNGCLVASVVIAVFLALIQLVNQAILW